LTVAGLSGEIGCTIDMGEQRFTSLHDQPGVSRTKPKKKRWLGSFAVVKQLPFDGGEDGPVEEDGRGGRKTYKKLHRLKGVGLET